MQLVDNPLAAHDLDLNSRVRTTKAEAVVNVRETPIEHMFARGEIARA